MSDYVKRARGYLLDYWGGLPVEATADKGSTVYGQVHDATVEADGARLIVRGWSLTNGTRVSGDFTVRPRNARVLSDNEWRAQVWADAERRLETAAYNCGLRHQLTNRRLMVD